MPAREHRGLGSVCGLVVLWGGVCWGAVECSSGGASDEVCGRMDGVYVDEWLCGCVGRSCESIGCCDIGEAVLLDTKLAECCDGVLVADGLDCMLDGWSVGFDSSDGDACIEATVGEADTLVGICDDGDWCTSDMLIGEVCKHIRVDGCCAADSECVDGGMCVIGKCQGGKCYYLPDIEVEGCCYEDIQCPEVACAYFYGCIGYACEYECLCPELEPEDCPGFDPMDCWSAVWDESKCGCVVVPPSGSAWWVVFPVDCCDDGSSCDDGDSSTIDVCLGDVCVKPVDSP
jgi:hypothetical protein